MKRFLYLSLMCLFSLSGTASAYYLDAPHNQANGMSCSTCHSHSVFSINPYVPQNIDDTLWNVVCNDCHGVGGPGGHGALHSDLQINGSQNWTSQCIDCHNPHSQDQYGAYANLFPGQLYLVQGQLVSGSPIVDNGDGTTTVQYIIAASQLPQAPWDDPSNWGSKGGAVNAAAADGSRGLIFATKDPGSAQLYEVISANGSFNTVLNQYEGYITLKGQTAYQGDVGVQTGALFGLFYGQLIKSTMDNVDTHGNGVRSVKFFSPVANSAGPGGFADNTPGTTSPKGICQVCHPTTVAHWNSDNSGDGPDVHYPTQNCMTCHPHTNGLKSIPAPTVILHSSASSTGYVSGPVTSPMYLWWETTGAMSAEIDNNIGSVELVDPVYETIGYIQITPMESAEYTITVTNAVGVTATSSVAIVIEDQSFEDAGPHTPVNGVTCSTCHNHPVFSINPYVPQNIDETRWNVVCNDCHSEAGTNPAKGTAQPMPMHSSLTIDGSYTWSTQCIDCHDSHRQAQLYWAETDESIYLVKAKHGATYNYDSATDSTTISYTNAIVQTGWEDPASWSDKNGKGRGLTLYPNFNDSVGSSSLRTYEIIGATKAGSNGSITVKGYMPQFIQGHDFGVFYGGYFRKQARISYNGPLKDFKYFNPKAPVGTAGNIVDSSGATNPVGLCQVCHNNTNNWKADGSGNTHEAANNCLECHVHTDGFKATTQCPQDDIVLQNQGIFSGQVVDEMARGSITVGPAYDIQAAANVNLSSTHIILGPGLSTQEGSELHVSTSLWGTLNTEPIAVEDTFIVDEGGSITGNVLSNDTDIDCDQLTAEIVNGVGHGSLEFNSDGSFTYDHDDSETTYDSFSYFAKDTEPSETVTVSISVNPVNDAPEAQDDQFKVYDYTASTFNVLANDVDVDQGDTLIISSFSPPDQGGSITNNGTSLSYTPLADFVGLETFTYTSQDVAGLSSVATVIVQVGNAAPVANAITVITDEFQPVSITLTGSDADNDPLTFTVSSAPINGTLSGTAPDIIYTPGIVPSGVDSFTFTAHDVITSSPPATVTITVNSVEKINVSTYQYDALGRITGKTIRAVPALDSDNDGIPDHVENILGSDLLVPQ